MRRTILAATGAALLFGAGVAGAETYTGKVVAKDPTSNTLTIQTDAGQQLTLRTSDAAVRAGDADIEMDRVSIGDQVRVEADTAAVGNQATASSVEVVTAGAAERTGMPTAADTTREPGTTGTADATREPAPTGMERTELGESGGPATRTGEDVDERAVEDDEQRLARLPDTAGPFPLIGLLGAASLTGALVLRRTRS